MSLLLSAIYGLIILYFLHEKVLPAFLEYHYLTLILYAVLAYFLFMILKYGFQFITSDHDKNLHDKNLNRTKSDSVEFNQGMPTDHHPADSHPKHLLNMEKTFSENFKPDERKNVFNKDD